MLVDQIEQMYMSIVDGKISLESAISSDIIDKVQERIILTKSNLSDSSNTNKLWINYQNMLIVARALITADRIGLWTLHLETDFACLPIFAPAGNFNCLKFAYLYVQEMSNLHIQKPDMLSN